jgi:hypothetical protein
MFQRYVLPPLSFLMMEAVRTSETSVDNYFIRQYIPEDNSELHTRRRENMKSHSNVFVCCKCPIGTLYIASSVGFLRLDATLSSESPFQ